MEVQRRFPAGTGRAVNADNLHITLAFLGSTPVERLCCIEEALAGVEMPGFTLQLDRLGHWRKPQVLWVGSETIPAPLTSLVDTVTMAASHCGSQLDTRPFQAHLTLFRKVRKLPRDMPDMTSIQWPVVSFALVESDTAASGVCYKVLKTWPLTSEAEGSASG